MGQYLHQLVNTIRFPDLLDITIIAIFSYIALIWFKKTASRFVLIGIFILAAIYAVARVFHLYITEYVLQGFFAILVFALIIIFQEDLRRFFERLATWRFIKKDFLDASLHYDAEIINRAVTRIAQSHRGALIVLKGDDFLDRHLKGGFDLKGTLSEAILESIFDTHSIGHDGAVVVEGGRIAKFGCHLPLSIKQGKIGNLGLRHTAALGLSERCDALCIAVSEERGTVSIAREGTLTRLHNPGDLLSILEQFYRKGTPEGKRGAWMRWISENWGEKVVAILLACGLWLAFGYQTESIRRDYVRPIVYRNLPSDWIIEEQKPKETTVTLMGSKQAFGLLNEESLSVTLDMAKVKEGQQELPIGNNHIQYPSNVTVVGIKPNKIRFIAHMLTNFEAPIDVRFSGTLPKGLDLQKINVSPASVKLKAPAKNIKNIKIITEPIDLMEITATTKLTPQLVIPPGVQFADGKQPSVEVTIEVESNVPSLSK
ncbi:MAG: diadenylate cyclase [Deltaproteobacteria bacterium]|nr:diadenylate cyclase [Deltaproteobacteria bacterium]